MPVAVNIHGGAFNLGGFCAYPGKVRLTVFHGSRYMNVSSLVSWSDEPFVGVSINYQ
jgi:hypothetical protein